jgi:outer membrane protein OmpA-like peptidoglycan-associated protein
MKSIIHHFKTPIAIAIAALMMAGCATTKTPDGANAVRNKLTQLQSNPELATRAPVAIQSAEAAVREAEKPTTDTTKSRHLVLIADRKVDTAVALAEKRLLEDQRKSISEASTEARLDARTREANQAHTEADIARMQADSARLDAEAAKQQAEDLQKQLAELNAKTTDRGIVVTLGDVLFDTGKSELRGGTNAQLSKLSGFLAKYQDRSVIIEGHTDSVGAEDYNLGLSQRRADSVKAFLVAQGVESSRITSVGKGESYPVGSNDTALGRQQNRRVEVIIANPATAAK